MSIAFTLPGNIPVYLFSLLLGAGAALGLAWTAWQAGPAAALPLVRLGAGVIIGSLIGARLAHLALHWSYFRAHPVEIAQHPLGGLAWPGAAAGGLLTLAALAPLSGLSLPRAADALLPAALSTAAAAWLGCWLDGCAYGPLSPAWWSVPGRDEWGNVDPRVPLQLTAALLTVVFGWGLETLQRRGGPFTVPGRAACLGGLGCSLLLGAVALLRADPAPLWRGLPLDAWAAAGLGLLAAAALAATFRAPAPPHNSLPLP